MYYHSAPPYMRTVSSQLQGAISTNNVSAKGNSAPPDRARAQHLAGQVDAALLVGLTHERKTTDETLDAFGVLIVDFHYRRVGGIPLTQLINIRHAPPADGIHRPEHYPAV